MIQKMNDLLCGGKSLIVLGLLMAFLAGCGGGSDGGGATPDPGPSASPGDDNNDDGDTNDDGSDDNSNDDQDDNNDDDAGDDASDGLTFETFQAASLVIGQPDFAGGDANQGGAAPNANSLHLPLGGVGYSSANDVLFVADSENARVLGFLGLPEMNNANADFVLGQPDFTTSEKLPSEEIDASHMFSPEALTTTGGNLIVTDTDYNRVTVYDGVPVSGGVDPVLVVGQESLEAYSGTCDQSTLQHPHAHFLSPDGKFLVADAAHNRILIWNEMPAENGEPADFVLGQNGFENCSYRQPENFRHPTAIWTDGERLIIADSEKHRILIWNTFPTANFEVPDVILGQSDMNHFAPNDDDQDGVTDGEYEAVTAPDGIVTLTANGDATARTLSYPRDIAIHEGKLYVADMDNNRVLIWNEIPTESFTPADNVIGQADFTSNEMNAGEAQPNEKGFRRPVGVSIIDGKLFVTEWENSRVMVFEGQ